MDRIAIPNKEIIESFRDDPNARYAHKHQVESNIQLHGIWQMDVFRKGQLISGGYPEPPNTFTTEGMAYMLNIMFHDVTKAASEIWYIHLYKNNVTPAVGNTAAGHMGSGGTYGVCQDADYDVPATNAPQYTTADTATASITNAVGGKAEYVFKQSITVYGVAMSTTAAKATASGTLMSAKKLTTARAVVDDDESAVTYVITFTTS